MPGTPRLAVSTRRLLRAGLLLALAAPAAGCADLRRAATFGGGEVNIESPVAPAVLAASRARLVTPRFSEVPPAPRDPPAPAAVKAQVGEELADRGRLRAWALAHPPMTADLDAFAQANRAATAQGGAPVMQDQSAAAQAYAARLREQAKPPPPPS